MAETGELKLEPAVGRNAAEIASTLDDRDHRLAGPRIERRTIVKFTKRELGCDTLGELFAAKREAKVVDGVENHVFEQITGLPVVFDNDVTLTGGDHAVDNVKKVVANVGDTPRATRHTENRNAVTVEVAFHFACSKRQRPPAFGTGGPLEMCRAGNSCYRLLASGISRPTVGPDGYTKENGYRDECDSRERAQHLSALFGKQLAERTGRTDLAFRLPLFDGQTVEQAFADRVDVGFTQMVDDLACRHRAIGCIDSSVDGMARLDNANSTRFGRMLNRNIRVGNVLARHSENTHCFTSPFRLFWNSAVAAQNKGPKRLMEYASGLSHSVATTRPQIQGDVSRT